MNRLGCDGWSTASAVPKEACRYPALAAEVKEKIASGAKALSHSYDLECTPEGVLHPIVRNSLCRAYGTRILLLAYPALKRWAKIYRPVPGLAHSALARFRTASEFQRLARRFAVCTLALSSLAAAQNITGKVTNATTGKPSAGDEVTLLSLSQGMQEVASTKSDAGGHFLVRGARRCQCAAHGAGYPRWGELLPPGWSADARIDHGRAHGLRLG